MCALYKPQHDALIARNKAVLERFHAAKAAKQQAIPSDDEEEDGPAAAAAAAGGGGLARVSPAKSPAGRTAAAAARPGARQVASPRLEGMDDGAGSGFGDDGGFGVDGGLDMSTDPDNDDDD
jgi:hypothetical protein